MTTRTGKICPKCKHNDVRGFPLVEGWKRYVCPGCFYLWDEKEEK